MEMPPLTPTQVLETLHPAGEKGLSKSALAKTFKPKKGRQSKEAKAAAEEAFQRTLAELEAAGQIINFGTAKTPRYVLARFDRRPALAREWIEQKATPGQATVFNRAALGRGCPKTVTKTIIDEAIAALVRERQLIIIQPGKSVFYLHARSVAPLIAPEAATAHDAGSEAAAPADKPPEASSKPSLPRGDAFSPEAVRTAYAELVREGGFTDVLISDLRQRSGVPLADLQTWLREQSRAGQAAPTRGDWSLADAAAHEAAIEVRGEPHLQVRLI